MSIPQASSGYDIFYYLNVFFVKLIYFLNFLNYSVFLSVILMVFCDFRGRTRRQ